jgi:hypothetical protein
MQDATQQILSLGQQQQPMAGSHNDSASIGCWLSACDRHSLFLSGEGIADDVYANDIPSASVADIS